MAKDGKQHFTCITCKVTACGSDYDLVSMEHGTPLCGTCTTIDLTPFITEHMVTHLKKP